MTRTIVIPLLALTVFVGCENHVGTTDSSTIESEFAVATLETREDVEHALANAINSDRAIVFVHMDWAIMAPQRELFTRFMVEYHEQFSENPVGFHYIDCTPITSDYTPLKSLPGWPGSGHDIYALQGTGGHGDVIWINQGVVKHVEMIFESKDTAELIDKTRAFLIPEDKGK